MYPAGLISTNINHRPIFVSVKIYTDLHSYFYFADITSFLLLSQLI